MPVGGGGEGEGPWVQRPSRDTPSPRALPLLLGSSEPGALCSECCAPCLLGTRKASSLQAQSAAEAAFGEAGRGSKTGPAWGSRALPTPPGREGKPRQKDLAPAPEIGAPSPPPLRVADPPPGPWQPHLLSTPQHPCSKPVETTPVPCTLCPPGAREAAGGGFLALGEALEGGCGGTASCSLCLQVQPAPPPRVLSPREPRPASPRWPPVAGTGQLPFSPRLPRWSGPHRPFPPLAFYL